MQDGRPIDPVTGRVVTKPTRAWELTLRHMNGGILLPEETCAEDAAQGSCDPEDEDLPSRVMALASYQSFQILIEARDGVSPEGAQPALGPYHHPVGSRP